MARKPTMAYMMMAAVVLLTASHTPASTMAIKVRGRSRIYRSTPDNTAGNTNSGTSSTTGGSTTALSDQVNSAQSSADVARKQAQESMDMIEKSGAEQNQAIESMKAMTQTRLNTHQNKAQSMRTTASQVGVCAI